MAWLHIRNVELSQAAQFGAFQAMLAAYQDGFDFQNEKLVEGEGEGEEEGGLPKGPHPPID